MTVSLSISIVTYAPDFALLAQVVSRLQWAVDKAVQAGVVGEVCLQLVNHGPHRRWTAELSTIVKKEWRASTSIFEYEGNRGFGMGHNLAVEHSKAAYHLVLNPDVLVQEDAVLEAIRYMEAHPRTGLLTPKAFWPDGSRQYLCKQHPTVFDLFLRGFAPRFVQKWWSKRLARYEMRGVTEDTTFTGVPYASGCFMFLRRDAFNAIGGFSPAFFLYFEDFDLSARLRRAGWRIDYVPQAIISHYGGNTARKGVRHWFLFVSSALKFFNRHGWRII